MAVSDEYGKEDNFYLLSLVSATQEKNIKIFVTYEYWFDFILWYYVICYGGYLSHFYVN